MKGQSAPSKFAADTKLEKWLVPQSAVLLFSRNALYALLLVFREVKREKHLFFYKFFKITKSKAYQNQTPVILIGHFQYNLNRKTYPIR